MNPKILFRTTCSTIIALLLLSGCNNDVDNGLITSVNMRDKFNQTADTFTPGEDETINMTLSIKNDSTSEKTLNFSSGYQYDFVIKDEKQTEIWRWSTDRSFTQALTSILIGPSDIQTVTYTWNQVIGTRIVSTETVDDVTTNVTENILIPSGSYTLEANFENNYGAVAQTKLTIL